MPSSRIRGELLSLRFPPAELAHRIYELEAENERLREACELVVAQDDWRDTVSISAKAYDACNAALSNEKQT